MIRNKIIIVEDDPGISKYLQAALRGHDYEPMLATDGKTALEMIASHCPDLLLLDLGLPDMDGSEIIRSVRSWSRMPIIVISARSAELDKAAALDMGADDYLTKPFNPLELVARVKTQLRRYTRYNQGGQPGGEAQEHDFRGLQISRATHKCVLFGEELPLTPLEFSILWYLCQHRGQVVSSEELFESVWGEKYMDSNNTVMSHIARLREKMHEPSRKPKFIKTVWGVGYTIE